MENEGQAKPRVGTDRALFHRLWVVTGLSNLGDGITLVALPWIASTITRDPIAIAGVAIAGRLPWLLLALPGGALIDLVDRKTLLLGGNLLRILLFGGLGFILAVGSLTTTQILAVAFALGCVEVVYDSVVPTYVPSVVAPADLPRANGQIASIELVSNEFAGKPLGGLLVGVWPPLAFFSRAAASAAAILLLFSLPADRPQRRVRQGWSESIDFMLSGVRLLWKDVKLRTYALAALWVNVALSFVVATQVLWAGEVLGLGAFGYGLLLAVSTVGGVAGGQVSGWLDSRLTPGRQVLLGIFVLTLACSALVVTRSPLIAGVLYLAASFAVVVISVVAVTARQTLVASDSLGRVNSAARLMSWSLTPLAFLLGGAFVSMMNQWVSRSASLQSAYGVSGLVLACCAAFFAVRLWRPGRLAE